MSFDNLRDNGQIMAFSKDEEEHKRKTSKLKPIPVKVKRGELNSKDINIV